MEFELKKDGEFSYLDYGQGPVVIVLHGLFGSLSNFEELLKLSDKKFRFLLPILPLYDCDLKNANLEGLLSFLRRFIDILKVKDFSLMGNSLGGHLALLHELNFPNQSKSLILSGSSGLFENSLGNEYPRRDKVVLKRKISEVFGNKNVVTEELVDNVSEIVNNYSNVLRIIKLAKSATRQNLTHEINKIKTKTLLIWGEVDHITPIFVANQFHERLTNAELAIIPNCGHAPMMEYPEEFSKHLFPFLNKIYSN